MSDVTLSPELPGAALHRPNLDARPNLATAIIFVGLLAAGVLLTLHGLMSDMTDAGSAPLAIPAFVLLGVALLIALGFEFVNGFHDTANAVATVIYTHSLPANVAVIWSGAWNLIGVLTSSGAVAFTIISLLPVELILQVGSNAGFAMIFALLIAAIIWNLGTWWLGLPASSSHTLIGSVIGVGLANQLLNPAGSGTSGVDWGQAMGVFRALLFSPLVGFGASALLLLAMKAVLRQRKLYEAPNTTRPPPAWIRGLLVLTCTGVSFAHGSNDGQKGMGLIMLILIGVVPTAYALNRAMPESQTPAFVHTMQAGAAVFAARAGGATIAPGEARARVTDVVRTRSFDDPTAYAAVAALAQDIAAQVQKDGAISRVPAAAVQNVRNEMYLASEAVRLMPKSGFSAAQQAAVTQFKRALDASTRFIPWWVKVSVAIALGLGTMVGWKRIVVTVGERIGKSHLTYGQGAAAELVAAGTILAADVYGLPVSTTHVLSSGVAGTMAANGSGLQWSTVRSLALAWVLTLPAAILLSGGLFILFRAAL
ncbi:MAG: inorganic phosphate transporter [Alphaproteobacteria bacterium]|nr:inorganic phosphate transporter [Alphaproteobacteria bacterium]